MAIFKRGNVYWYHFLWNSQHVQKSTKQGNPNVARTIEAAYRTALAKGEAGIFERKPAPTLRDFKQRFTEAIKVRCAEKPRTVAFYEEKLARLLEFEPLASARLDRIDEALIESYVQERRKQVAPATVNRQLATLRRLLRLAYEWQVINRVPRIRMLPGERNREFVLSHKCEADYLKGAPQPLRDVALLTLDTGLRVGEALALEVSDVSSGSGRGRDVRLRSRARWEVKERPAKRASNKSRPSYAGRPHGTKRFLAGLSQSAGQVVPRHVARSST